MNHVGGCHCGNLEIAFSSDIAPARFGVRECQCSFCRKHGSRTVADPKGKLVVRVKDAERLSRYRFGLETAEFLVCRSCGVYVAAITRNVADPRGIAIVNAFSDRTDFSANPIQSRYDGETEAERRMRRQTTWTPARLELNAG